jgi:hypothetical protein
MVVVVSVLDLGFGDLVEFGTGGNDLVLRFRMGGDENGRMEIS